MHTNTIPCRITARDFVCIICLLYFENQESMQLNANLNADKTERNYYVVNTFRLA